VTTRHRDALRRAQTLALRRHEFGQAVCPVVMRAERRAGVNNHRAAIVRVHQRNRFARSKVRQAQERNVRRIDQPPALLHVLASRFLDTQHLDVTPLGQIFENLQAGGAFLSVDKYFRGHLDLAWVGRAPKSYGWARSKRHFNALPRQRDGIAGHISRSV